MPGDRDTHERAYRNTTYRVLAGEGSFEIRVGQRAPAVDALLARSECSAWAFVTACNPYSEPRTDAENRAAQNRLEQWVEDAGEPCECPRVGRIGRLREKCACHGRGSREPRPGALPRDRSPARR